jgi:hypothetical protein
LADAAQELCTAPESRVQELPGILRFRVILFAVNCIDFIQENRCRVILINAAN